MANIEKTTREIESACRRINEIALSVSASCSNWSDQYLPEEKQRPDTESARREGPERFKKGLREMVLQVEIIRSGYKAVTGKDILQE